jgi:hypothetical protein
MLSSCTLPEWVPEVVSGFAIKHFGQQLRTALAELMNSSTVALTRVKSAQSESLSVNSFEGGLFSVPSTTYMKYLQPIKR